MASLETFTKHIKELIRVVRNCNKTGSTFIAHQVGNTSVTFLVTSVYNPSKDEFIFKKTDGTIVKEGIDFEV